RLGEETGFDFLAAYSALSDAMQRVSSVAKRRPGLLGGALKQGLATLGQHYHKKTGFSAVWRGDVQLAPSVVVSADSSFEGLRYQSQSIWVELDKAQAIYGESFDPYGSADWCVSADGQRVTRADDYYGGR
ncbi:hypothetical protein HZU77_016845, partial [Neisseriaceae bacterium TC5R-5]|nr:hypothetical protein [Neisseriaceae bacterium TC5R-5]